jgi:AmmeMemoRadiSam system protein B
MVKALEDSVFVDGEAFETIRALRHNEFAAAPTRIPVHSGAAYPSEEESLTRLLHEKLGVVDSNSRNSHQIGIAAPHVSPDGGWACYASAYRNISKDDLAGKTVVILGTSHYGAPEQFGLTRKPYQTPLGDLNVNTEMVDWIEKRAASSIVMEDYCHAIEHSIEFQCLFLRHLAGDDLRILPILCGPLPSKPDDRRGAGARRFSKSLL